ncbi:ABC transporter permease [Naumannella halotolerans]
MLLRQLGLRILQAIGVLWAAYTVAFAVLYALPGDPAAIIAGGGDSGTQVSEQAVAELRARYGLDRPIWVQYLDGLAHAVRGDLGQSMRIGSVSEAIVQAVPATAQIAGLAIVMSIIGGAGLALLASYLRSPLLRQLLLSLPSLGVSVPSFWLALLLLQVFSFRLGWFPAFGNDGFGSLILPSLTLAALGSALIGQIFARSLLAEQRAGYVATAKAKGVSAIGIHLRHVARNAALPSLTLLGVLVSQFLAGAVVTETVFSRTGLGQLTTQAVTTQDIPLALGIVVFGAAVVVVTTLIVDLVYPLLDPRVSTGGAR